MLFKLKSSLIKARFVRNAPARWRAKRSPNLFQHSTSSCIELSAFNHSMKSCSSLTLHKLPLDPASSSLASPRFTAALALDFHVRLGPKLGARLPGLWSCVFCDRLGTGLAEARPRGPDAAADGKVTGGGEPKLRRRPFRSADSDPLVSDDCEER
jgi:hypothetical protein